MKRRVFGFVALAAVMAAGAYSVWSEAAPDPIPLASSRPGESSKPMAIDNGDVVAELGVPSGLVGADGESDFAITVTGIDLIPSCPSRIDGEMIHADEGRFLVAHVEAVVDASFTDEGEEASFITVDSDAFRVLDTDGEEPAGSATEKAYGCFSLEDRIQPFVNPGESVTGVVVLESSIEHGYLEFNPWGVPGSGWVWKF